MLFVSFHVRIESSFGEQMTIRNANSRWTQKQCTVKRLKSSKPQNSSLIWHTFNIQAIVSSAAVVHTYIHQGKGTEKRETKKKIAPLHRAFLRKHRCTMCALNIKDREYCCVCSGFFMFSLLSLIYTWLRYAIKMKTCGSVWCVLFFILKKVRMHFRYVLIYIELRKPVELF